ETTIETREAPPAHFLIKIESFSLIDNHGIDKYETKEVLDGDYKWILIIYPNGHKRGRDGEGYVSVYLSISDTTSQRAYWEVDATFSICLFNQISDNYRYAIVKAHRFHAMKVERGFSQFISKNDLIDPSNGYLIDDNCVFGVEVFVHQNKAMIECLSLKNAKVPYK
ncbi:ubiquitin carboxyl-terminal hydrolase 12, partial [Phtheirospermum japonicum]